MASNRVYVDGRKLRLPVEANSVSGSPVAVSNRGGVALTNRDVGGFATVDTQGVFNLPVTGAVVNVGDAVYYGANANPDLRLDTDATGRQFFGYGLEAKAAGIASIPVLIGEASGISGVMVGGVVQTDRIEVSNAEIKALFATPKELVAAPGVGFAVQLMDIALNQIHGGTNDFTGDRALRVGYNDATTPVIGDVAFGDFHQVAHSRLYIAQPVIAIHGNVNLFENLNVALQALVGEIAGNAGDDNTWVIFVTYRIVDLT